MNLLFLAQAHRLNSAQESVKTQFEEGGSVRMALLVLASLVAVVVVTGLISWIQRPLEVRTRGNPRKLFQRLLHQLPLSHRQRRFLWGLAKDLRLPNPTLLLLSPGYFATCVEQWQTGSSRRFHKGRTVDAVALERIRVAVFPKAGPTAVRNAPHHRPHESLFAVQPMSDRVGPQRRV